MKTGFLGGFVYQTVAIKSQELLSCKQALSGLQGLCSFLLVNALGFFSLPAPEKPWVRHMT